MTNEQIQTVPSGDKVRCAYTVGLLEDGRLVFTTDGPDVGLIQLLGLHMLAANRIKGILDQNQKTGDAISLEVLKLLHNALTPVEPATTMIESGEKKGGE